MKAKKLFPDISFNRLWKAVHPIDNLESTDKDKSLSANMGREINEKIENTVISYLKGNYVIKEFKSVMQDSNAAVTVDIDKFYIVAYTRGAANTHGISSGGEIIAETGNATSTYFYIGIVRTTSTSLVLQGTNNKILLIEISQMIQ